METNSVIAVVLLRGRHASTLHDGSCLLMQALGTVIFRPCEAVVMLSSDGVDSWKEIRHSNKSIKMAIVTKVKEQIDEISIY